MARKSRARPVKLNIGPQRDRRVPHFATEPQFIAAVQREARALTDQLIDIIRQFEDVAPDVMLRALEPTFDRSQTLCPVQTGELRDSGYLEVTSFRGNPRVEMGYGRNGQPDYAVVVHEDLTAVHPAPTQAKFLERPVREDLPNIYARLGSAYAQFAGFVGGETVGY